VAPSIVWGIGIGLVIAAIDTVSLVLSGSPGMTQWPIADIDFVANVVLYSLIGYRVGRATGVLRDAAEAGVMAGVLVGLIGIAATAVLRPQGQSVDSVTNIVGVMAQNVAIGGVLAILSGWLGTRSRQDRPTARS
jgi:hypothetical protein